MDEDKINWREENMNHPVYGSVEWNNAKTLVLHSIEVFARYLRDLDLHFRETGEWDERLLLDTANEYIELIVEATDEIKDMLKEMRELESGENLSEGEEGNDDD